MPFGRLTGTFVLLAFSNGDMGHNRVVKLGHDVFPVSDELLLVSGETILPLEHLPFLVRQKSLT